MERIQRGLQDVLHGSISRAQCLGRQWPGAWCEGGSGVHRVPGALRAGQVRANLLRVLLMATFAPAAAQQPPSYAEAMAEAARRANDPGVKEWIEAVGKPFWNQHLQSVFYPCLQNVPENS